ncbi:hypothetical protein LAZ67_12000930 [Cordylochernes scorpioides]|uniref:Reverse transcriptase domain-containing protein n=1 Tax=Cordylochernes scorpioides TaxID=51811 RepID=A0ABY6L5R9_9ARAC|nr:hypothetical protein LAZ67_12000930 [Cordylochernes scorpioides]
MEDLEGSLQILLDFKVDDQLYSDHHPLVLTIKGQNFNEKKTKREDYNITRYRWSADGLATFKMKLEELREKNIPASDDLVYTFNQRILEAMSSAKITYSIKGGPRKSKPWFDKDCYDMKKLAKESLKKYRKTNRLEDRECYASSRKKYLALLDLKRKGFDNEKQEILRNAKDSKTFWKTIALYKSTSIIQGEISIQDWLNFYRELMTTEKNLRICNLHNVISQNDPILDSEITNADIYKEIAGLRSNKACGPDGIPNEVLKTLPDSYILLLKQLYNSVMTTGKYPAIWTNSTIHPIFKNGYKNSPSNYRDLPSVNLPEFGDIHLLLYADDIAIIGESRINLQKKIKILKEYLDENLMTLNESKSKIMVFRNGVRAVLMYAAPLWATEHKDLLDNIQDIFIRRFLNLPRYTPGYLIRLETGRISLSVTALKLTLKYWLREQLDPQHHRQQEEPVKLDTQHHGQQEEPVKLDPQHHGQQEEPVKLDTQHHGQQEEPVKLDPQHHGQQEESVKLDTQHHGQQEEPVKLDPQHHGQQEEPVKLDTQHHGQQEEPVKLDPQHHGQKQEPNQKLDPQHHGQQQEPVKLDPQHHGQQEEPVKLDTQHHGQQQEPVKLDTQHHGQQEEPVKLDPQHHGQQQEPVKLDTQHHGQQEEPVKLDTQHHGQQQEPVKLDPQHHGQQQEPVKLDPQHHGQQEEPVKLDTQHHGQQEEPVKLDTQHHGQQQEPVKLDPQHHGQQEEPVKLDPQHHGQKQEPVKLDPQHHGQQEPGKFDPQHHGQQQEPVKLDPQHHGQQEPGKFDTQHHGQQEPGKFDTQHHGLQE